MASGELIRKTRELVGESQGQFGKRFGVDQSTVARWEAGGAPKRGSAAVLIARELAAIEAAMPAVSAEADRAELSKQEQAVGG